ncbi:hypothetical protein H8356DRAFT_1339219 [Neocallimastix lanati (nom. inval.)]|nr:hypothetical protein H8356DRAFT_1339219 [Neocallimastix sp. JGI-2020a]
MKEFLIYLEQRDLSLDEIFIPYLIENHNNILSFFRNIAITIDNEDVYNLEGSWLDVEEFCNNIGYTFIKLRAMSTLNNIVICVYMGNVLYVSLGLSKFILGTVPKKYFISS